MEFLEKLRGSLFSKTSNAALAVVIIGVAEQNAPGVLAKLVAPDYYGLALACVGGVFWLLRWVTQAPLTAK